MTRRFLRFQPFWTGLLLVALFGLLILIASHQILPRQRSFTTAQDRDPSMPRLVGFSQQPVPSLDGGVEWINSGPITLEQLRGKIVLLDFWTYCCINCHHILPTLAKLEKKYPHELVIIGVHSGKFSAERNSENIRRKVAEYRIKHPVVNDANMTIWERFQVNTWPTLILIAPDGRYYDRGSGEVAFETLDNEIGKLATAYKGRLNLKPIEFEPEMNKIAPGALLFPGKVLADKPGNRLFISDTGHNRIVQTSLDGKGPVVIGSGAEGFVDGDFSKARFNRPQGICLSGEALYVADTENHAIRAVDLQARQVSTISGTGSQSERSPLDRYVGPAKTSALSSPWDIIQLPGTRGFYIAMAGPHEIWKLYPEKDEIGVWAGSGYENIQDGPRDSARFAQPSGLATDGEHLFVADSEVSGIRIISGIKEGRPAVGRIVGAGLFKFGDIDGIGSAVRLQHCLGVAYGDGKLFIADTYNNKVKVCDPRSRSVKTFAGDGKPGSGNNPPRFYQPGGLSVAGDSLYVADTNNHQIRVIDVKSGAVRTLDITGLGAPRIGK
ncbi:MAG: thioredoxin-like domain-containing protein [Isosphaeraceae bacterium]